MLPTLAYELGPIVEGVLGKYLLILAANIGPDQGDPLIIGSQCKLLHNLRGIKNL